MQVIREAKIVVHLEQGPTNLKAPDLSAFLKQQEQVLDYIKKTADEQERLNRAQQGMGSPSSGPAPGAIAPSSPAGPGGFRIIDTKPQLPPDVASQLPPEWGGTAGTTPAPRAPAAPPVDTSGMERAVEIQKERLKVEQDLMKAIEAGARHAEQQGAAEIARQKEALDAINARKKAEEEAQQKLDAASKQAVQGLMQVGEGFFRIGRAAVLLGASSDESFSKLIKGLAQVQAYYDLFKGSIQIIVGLNKITAALAVAQALQAASSTAAAGGMTYYARATALATAANTAFMASLGPVGWLLIGIGAAVALLAGGYDLLFESEAEAAEAAKAHAETVQAATEKQMASLMRLVDLQMDLNKIRREGMSFEGQQTSMSIDRGDMSRRASELYDDARGGDPAAEQQKLQTALDLALKAKALDDERIANAMKYRDAEIQIRQEKIKQIEAQEKSLETARRQLKIEEDKHRATQAQIGSLTDFEQKRLLSIRDRLRAGQNISGFDEDFFAQNGGQGAAGAISRRRSDRVDATGQFGSDWLDGIAGAEDGVKGATDEVAKATKALADLIAKLGETGTAAEVKARYEAQMKAIEKSFLEAMKKMESLQNQNVELLEKITQRLKELEQAVLTG